MFLSYSCLKIGVVPIGSPFNNTNACFSSSTITIIFLPCRVIVVFSSVSPSAIHNHPYSQLVSHRHCFSSPAAIDGPNLISAYGQPENTPTSRAPTTLLHLISLAAENTCYKDHLTIHWEIRPSFAYLLSMK